jgi:two-component system chemotaxis sensor kinase CheA
MTDDHLEAFVRESEQSVVELNNSLLALEDDPDDRAAMDTVFRTAHTLKGNFAAMGFEDASEMAHAIEDLLDEVRDGEMAVTPEMMDLVFEGVDHIEDALAEIAATGTVETDPAETVAAVRETIEAGDTAGVTAGEQASEDDGDDGTEPVAAPVAAVADDLGGVASVVHVAATLGDSEMPGVDGMLLLEGVEETVELVATVPDPDAVADGDHDGSVDLFVAAADPDAVEAAVTDLGQVETATATDVTEHVHGGDGASEAESGGGTDDEGDGRDDDARSADDGADESDESGGNDSAGSDGGAGTVKSVTVDVDQLDDLYNQVEQLVTSRIKLRRSVEGGDVSAAADTLDELDKVTRNLQGTVMDMRLVPLSKVVDTFPRMVRDIAREEGKKIDFEMAGTDVELDRTILDEVSDPLMHVLRNAADHGIEAPEEREGAGKPREGEIRLRARRERDHVTVSVADDGAGLDAEELKAQAREQGVRSAEELAEMDDGEVYELIFHPGFSTAEEVTDVSGRGVGMDVVSSTVSRLDGDIEVESEPGEGTTVTLRLPVSVAIVRVLFVEVGDREYGIPVKNVDEITGADAIEVANGTEVVSHDGAVYPVVRLAEALDTGSAAADGGRAAERADDGKLVRILPAERRVALHCDAVARQEEVVIKPFEGSLSDTPGLSGTAVVGDGNVVPILDVATL